MSTFRPVWDISCELMIRLNGQLLGILHGQQCPLGNRKIPDFLQLAFALHFQVTNQMKEILFIKPERELNHEKRVSPCPLANEDLTIFPTVLAQHLTVVDILGLQGEIRDGGVHLQQISGRQRDQRGVGLIGIQKRDVFADGVLEPVGETVHAGASGDFLKQGKESIRSC